MLKLYVIRHGKAATHADKDFNRHLAEKGIKQSQFLNALLEESIENHIHVFYSKAKRTEETYETVFKTIEHTAEGNINLYGADFMQWLSTIQSSKTSSSIAIVGHNPGVSRLVSYLCGSIIHMQTGTMATISFELNQWNLIGRDLGSLVGISRWNEADEIQLKSKK